MPAVKVVHTDSRVTLYWQANAELPQAHLNGAVRLEAGLVFGPGEPGAWDEAAVGSPVVSNY